MEVIAEKQLEKMSENDKERPNVVLEDVDGNTGKSVVITVIHVTSNLFVRQGVWRGMYPPLGSVLTYQKNSEKEKP